MTEKEYNQKIGELNYRIREIQNEKKLVKEEFGKTLLEFNGLEVGKRFTYKGQEYACERVDVDGIFWLVARKIRKDGTPAKNTITLYNYPLKRP